MKRIGLLVLSAFCGVVQSSYADFADQSAFVSLLFGNGFRSGYTIGFGARSGVILKNSFYLGGVAIYHLGGSVENIPLDFDLSSGVITYGSATLRSLHFIGESGFNLRFSDFEFLFSLGFGVAYLMSSAQGSDVRFCLSPGIRGIYRIDDTYFAGIENRITLADGFSTYSIFLTGGLRF